MVKYNDTQWARVRKFIVKDANKWKQKNKISSEYQFEWHDHEHEHTRIPGEQEETEIRKDAMR